MQTGEVGMQHFRGLYIPSDLNHFLRSYTLPKAWEVY